MKLINKKIYTKDSENILLEQYKLYVESADKISDRRININNFFITLNTLVLTMIGIFYENKLLLFILSILAILFSILWLLNITNYSKINNCKFNIISNLERYLPVKIYSYEWKMMGNGKDKKKYLPVSKIELCLPIIFILAYIGIILFCIFNNIQINIKFI